MDGQSNAGTHRPPATTTTVEAEHSAAEPQDTVETKTDGCRMHANPGAASGSGATCHNGAPTMLFLPTRALDYPIVPVNHLTVTPEVAPHVSPPMFKRQAVVPVQEYAKAMGLVDFRV